MCSTQLSLFETNLLAKGLGVSITSETLPIKDITTIEDAVKYLRKEEADTICAKISLTIQNSKPPADNLSKNDHNLGRSTVILNREDYLEKCMNHINTGPY